MISKQRILALVLGMAVVAGTATAQEEIQREVRVVKPYTPTLSDAEKMRVLSEMDDTVRTAPVFSYKINPRRYSTNFNVNPIQPARMVGLPMEKLYKTQFTLGAGNYLTPWAELTVNSLRDRRSSVGLYLMHHSSGGKVRLDNDMKVSAPFSDNLLEFQARRINFRSTLEGSVTGGFNSRLYYGYNPDLLITNDKDSIRQRIYSAGAKIRYYSTHPDSSHFNHSSRAGYQLTADAYSNFEHHFRGAGTVGSQWSEFYAGGDISLDYYRRTDSLNSSTNVIFRLNPYLSKAADEWRFQLGVNMVVDAGKDNYYKFYPKALFEFDIVKNVLTPYMGIDGYRKVNSYRTMLFENPFIRPGLEASNTNYSLIGYFGMKGRYSSRMAFDLKVSYSRIDSMLFFVNDTTDLRQHQFVDAYDDAGLIRAGGEVSWNQDDKLKILFRAQYSAYTLDKFEHAWHLPAFDASLSGKYNLRDKILLDADIFFTGKRYAPTWGATGDFRELKPFLDANLGVEYRYTRMLSFFLKFNNLTGSKYDIWNRYPAQRFQVLGGFSYAL